MDHPVRRPVAREIAHRVIAPVTPCSPPAQGIDVRDDRSGRLVHLLRHLRSTLTRYVRERRAASIPLARVLVEVQDLVRQASVLDAWADPIEALMDEALRCTRTA